MADITYPAALRTAITNTQQRQTPSGFVESDPAAGKSYSIAITTNQPTFFTFDLIFSRTQAAYFDAWCRKNEILSKSILFNFPILDEYGVSMQECRFLAGGLPVQSMRGSLVIFSGCKIIVADYQSPDPDVIIDFYDVYGDNPEQAQFLDIAINQNYPAV